MSKPVQRGKFISLEGTEGVGKSTNLAAMLDCLDRHNIAYIQTREPGGTPLAEELRELLLAPREEAVAPAAELLMVFAARAQHLETLIKPALDDGLWVVSDRFTDATFAYQGGGRGLSMEMIAALETMIQQGLAPDRTILLDLAPEVGMQRAEQRGELDRFETEQMAFFDKVRAAYLERAAADPNRFVIVDASQSVQQVSADVVVALEQLIAESQA